MIALCKLDNSPASVLSGLLRPMTHLKMVQPGHGRLRAQPLRALLAVVAVIAVLGVACSDKADSAADEPIPTTTTTQAPTVAGLDLAAGSEVDLGDGWTIAPCESGPPLFCARHEGENGTQSVIELMSVPTASYPVVKQALDDGREPIDALEAQAAEYQATFEADRAAGCGGAYEVTPIGPEAATVAGQPGILYGFNGHQDGRHVERNVHLATIRGETLHIVATTAVDDGSCMDDGTLAEFSVTELTQLERSILQMIAAGTLP